MNSFVIGFKRIVNNNKTRHRRGQAIRLRGIRSLECNFNAQNNTYNPHMHMLVENKECGEYIIREWLQLCGNRKTATPKAQDCRRLDNRTNAFIEVIKYGTKIFTNPDVKMKKGRIDYHIYPTAQYNIIRAMDKIRIFERFGIEKTNYQPNYGTFKNVKEYDDFTYNLDSTDWINEDHGECLSGYIPNADIDHIFENKVRMDLQ